MPVPESEERLRFAVAEDVGRIELLHAAYHRRRLPPHIHDAYSLSVSLRGGLAFDHRGSKHTAPSGVISCIEPGEVHNAYAAGDHGWAYVSLLVPPPVILAARSGMAGDQHLPGLARRVIADAALAHKLIELHSILEASQDVLERQSATVSILAAFFGRHSTAAYPAGRIGREREAIRRVRERLRECYRQQISLTELSAVAGLSSYYFLRVFSAETGLTPHAYLNQIRIVQAKLKLAAGAPAAEVALECGFCDQSHLVRQFKKASGLTPGQYQNAHRQRAW